MTKIIAPSVLAANFGNLDKEVEMLNQSVAEWIHLDIMDGVFVPNISFGMPIVEHIAKQTKKTKDVHLMIIQPERYIETFKKVGADILTIHYEASTHLHRSLQQIRALGMKAGVSLNPHTPIHILEDIIQEIDLLLIMSVNPGFGGQSFIEHTYNKIQTARNLIDKRGCNTLIEVDGGVNLTNASRLFEAGANVLVAGNAVFSAPDPIEYIQNLRNS